MTLHATPRFGQSRFIRASYLRTFIFGVEDGLVSTVGLLSGIAIAGTPRATIFLTGLVLIFVEGFSMAVGSFLSESSAEEFLEKKERAGTKLSLLAGVLMFASYVGAGFIALAPYLFLPVSPAFYLSVILSLIALLGLGVIGGKLSQVSLTKSGIKMVAVGGVAILVGIVVGRLVQM